MPRRWPTVLLLAISAVAAAGCADTRPTGDAASPRMDGGASRIDAAGLDGSSPTDDGSTPTDDGGTAPADGGGSSGDAGGGPSATLCQLGCATGADCTTASAAFDADNYRCDTTAGACRYTGCNDDAECRATFASDAYVCRDPGTGVPSCVQACATAVDCGSGTPAFDGDNYRCGGGVCVYEGCRDDAECTGTFGAGYGCFAQEPPETPLPIPTAERNCVRRCTTASDCGTDGGAFGDDNYACDGGACRYVGCSDDAECRTSFASDAYVCR